MEVRFDDLPNFPFWFAIDNLWRWSFIVRTVSVGLVVSGQEVNMEDGMDLHQWREGQVIGDGGQFLIDKEWSVLAGR